jgi:glycerol-3-phosphate dehydrogenase
VAVARAAALRGQKVLLVERGDLAGATSSRTSKMIHGGIRYLEQGRLGLVRESLRERRILLRSAPEFVRPVTFLLPTYRGDRRPGWMLHLGLRLYGALAGSDGLATHRSLTRDHLLAREPGLNPDGLTGGFEFHDAQMDDALVCVATALAAERAGATVRTHTEVRGLERAGSGWRARLHDHERGIEEAVEARSVVNATGPWADEIRNLALPGSAPAVRRTRGTHVVVEGALVRHALLLTARRDGRVFFVLPWGAHTMFGTTDVDDDRAPDSVGPTAEDVRYLCEEAAAALPSVSRAGGPVRAFAGVRSLARGTGSGGDPSSNSREHRLLFEEGILTVIGGKFTTHRSMAERVLARLAAVGGRGERGAAGRADAGATATTLLAHDRERGIEELRRAHPERVDLPGGLTLREAELSFSVRVEHAKTLEDALLRRSRLWLDGRALRRAAEPASRWIARWRGWDEPRREREVAAFVAALDHEERIIAEGTS